MNLKNVASSLSTRGLSADGEIDFVGVAFERSRHENSPFREGRVALA
jgi:hypothetical protein